MISPKGYLTPAWSWHDILYVMAIAKGTHPAMWVGEHSLGSRLPSVVLMTRTLKTVGTRFFFWGGGEEGGIETGFLSWIQLL